MMTHKQFAALELDDAEDVGRLSGYPITWDRDSDGDQIARGAARKSIRDRKQSVPVLLMHQHQQWAGVTTTLAEDDRGVRMEAQLFPDTSAGREAWAILKNAAAVKYPVGLSVGFMIQDQGYDKQTDTRIIKQLELWEVSLTPFPANREARADQVKYARFIEQILRDVGDCSVTKSKRVASMLMHALPFGTAAELPRSLRDVETTGDDDLARLLRASRAMEMHK